MTATPRMFSDSAKVKADNKNVYLWSMDKEKDFGKEIYRLGFGQAVNEGLLSDYKVLVLTLSDKDISPSIQNMVADRDNTINADDASKLIGCVNALSKQIIGDNGVIKDTDPLPMRRAVAFCQNIAVSKKITEYFNTVPEKYIADQPPERQEKITPVKSQHIDGSMNAMSRDGLIRWLKAKSDECRILTNVRCLSEGVDVPSLDAVMFLSARNSEIDVVQSVGRVMRTAPNKKYGYIIIPVVIPSDIPAEKALEDNDRFKVVWTVLKALRAHDDRFNATVNTINIKNRRPVNILVGGVPHGDDDADSEENSQIRKDIQTRLTLQFEELQDKIYAKMVDKVGDRQYWEHWAANVGEISAKQIGRIKNLVKNPDITGDFDKFVKSLRNNINESIDEDQAIEMLSQHMITKPVFEALFENYSFAENNPVSKSMQKMIDILEENSFDKDTEQLSDFYNSVRDTVKGIDDPKNRQKIIIKLYDNFFQNAYKKVVQKFGIAYTPVEIVDFILHSVDDVLKEEFGRSLSDENVNILDPFTGTGTFITRLLESDLIADKDLQRKYSKEIFANEIVLLAYYIAAVNIENAYHSRTGENTTYQAFNGICLTDTFQMYEYKEGEQIASEFFPKNNERVKLQKKSPITVIVGNPPYSMGQKNENDNAQNMKYPKLERRIEKTYAVESVASNKKPLHDSYIKAFRWATDRLNPEGIICFISNSGWLDGNAMDGFRKYLENDFSSIYLLNLRGSIRGKSGVAVKKEGQNIFNILTGVSISLLIKKPKSSNEKATIYYHDIGDCLTRKQKLSTLESFVSVNNKAIKWEILHPNKEGDWINKRNPIFDTYIPIGDKKGKEEFTSFFHPIYSLGLASGRDSWCYNSSKSQLVQNLKMSIEYYNSEVENFKVAKSKNSKITAEEFVSYDSTKFSWAVKQRKDLQDGIKYELDSDSFVESMYRPYFKQYAYFNRQMNNRTYQLPKIYPNKNSENLVICMDSVGGSKDFSVLISDCVPDLHFTGSSQCFPLYYYESKDCYEIKAIDSAQTSLFAVAEASEPDYQRKDGISDFILNKAQTQYKDRSISKEDIFYYVYGILHSKEYRTTFANDLKKMLARIPLVKSKDDFFAFSRAGRALADLHLHYETVTPYPDVGVIGAESGNFRVTQMKFVKKGDKSTIIYNSAITVSNIPEKAYEYVISGKSAIEWIMERYCVRPPDPDTKITNDANDWAAEVGNERYILDLLLSVINVSVQTVDIVNGLPKLKFN